MRNLFLLVILALLLFSQKPRAQENQSNQIEDHIKVLASDKMQGRETGSEGLERAAKYISGFFKRENLKPYYKSYIDTFYLKDERPAYNIIAHIEGTETYLKKRPLVISAHYDHIGYKQPIKGDSIANGANDNVSGTVAVMQLAKFLKNTAPARPILFVLFDAEEQGLMGSKYLAEKFKSEDLKPYVVFNIEMIGAPMTNKPKKAFLTGFEISNFAEVFNSYLPEDALILSEQSQQNNLFKRSDNFPFFNTFEIPSHSVSTFDFTNFEFYHHVDDETERIDFKHMQSLISLWSEALQRIAEHKENIIKI